MPEDRKITPNFLLYNVIPIAPEFLLDAEREDVVRLVRDEAANKAEQTITEYLNTIRRD